jgi:hypothetical protein
MFRGIGGIEGKLILSSDFYACGMSRLWFYLGRTAVGSGLYAILICGETCLSSLVSGPIVSDNFDFVYSIVFMLL